MSCRWSTKSIVGVWAACTWLVAIVPPAAAQDSSPTEQPYYWEEPIKVWTGSLGAGLAMTSGNTDTSTFNVSYELTRDAQQRTIFKATGLFIRSEQDDILNVDRTVADVRVDYRLTYALTVFGRLQYLRDSFKRIEYLLAPTIGVGYSFVDTPQTKFDIDVSLGTALERNTERAIRTSPAFQVGERFSQQITKSARIGQSASGLWKVDDPGDAFYTFGASIAASITERAELKAEVLDTFKSELTFPVDPAVFRLRRNDVSLLMSVVYKF
jgi:putative salt-induced outer membrane protein YdiY